MSRGATKGPGNSISRSRVKDYALSDCQQDLHFVLNVPEEAFNLYFPIPYPDEEFTVHATGMHIGVKLMEFN